MEKRVADHRALALAVGKLYSDFLDVRMQVIRMSLPTAEDTARVHSEIVNSMFEDEGKLDPQITENFCHEARVRLRLSISETHTKPQALRVVGVLKQAAGLEIDNEKLREFCVRLLKQETSPEVSDFKERMYKALSSYMSDFLHSNEQMEIFKEDYPYLLDSQIKMYVANYKIYLADTYVKVLEDRKYEGRKLDSKKLNYIAIAGIYNFLKD